ncbi:MAG: SUF system NifU family Fe-S cluster assembly protein [Thermoanaerobaculia bacterium]
MSDLRELYQEIILDHNRNPRNFGRLDPADRTIEGFNPLCGDHYTVTMNMEGDRITAVRFEGSGCAISKASASVMTAMVQGKRTDEAEHLFEEFRRMVTGEKPPDDLEKLGKLAAFSGVSEFPSRVKCAILAWHAMSSALHGEQKVTTE